MKHLQAIQKYFTGKTYPFKNVDIAIDAVVESTTEKRLKYGSVYIDPDNPISSIRIETITVPAVKFYCRFENNRMERNPTKIKLRLGEDTLDMEMDFSYTMEKLFRKNEIECRFKSMLKNYFATDTEIVVEIVNYDK